MLRCMKLVALAAVLVTVFVASSPGGAATSRHAKAVRTPAPYTNCTTFNKKYAHGVGRAKARDKTSGTPVTTFKRSTKLYNLAMTKNGRLDGDKDGIVCEKA